MNSLKDIIGGGNLYGGSNYSYTYDRFCNPFSAIYFNNGFLQVPPGVYFSGDFTFIAWIKLKSHQKSSGIIDFGSYLGSNGVENIGIRLEFQFYLNAFVSSADFLSKLSASSVTIALNQWYHVAYVLNKTIGYIYVNGTKAASGTLNIPKNVMRTLNYIGKDKVGAGNADAVYDDIRIYKIALSWESISNDYTKSSNNGILRNTINFNLITYLKNLVIFINLKR
jgi:hypothetical protein